MGLAAGGEPLLIIDLPGLYVTNSDFRGQGEGTAWSPRGRECTPHLTSTASYTSPFLPQLCSRLDKIPAFPPSTGGTLPKVSCRPSRTRAVVTDRRTI